MNEKHLSEEDGNRITGVTVFQDRAQIKRQVTVDAESGMNRYMVELTESSVERDSAQAQILGKGEIFGVQYQEIPAKDIPQQKVRELDEQKRSLTRNKRSLQKKRDAVQRQLQFLDSLTEFAKIEIPKEIKTEFPPMDRIEGVLGFIDNHYGKLGDEELEFSHRIDDLDRDISAVERHLKNLRKSTSRDHKVIEVLFRTDEAQEITIEISYIAYHASWKPVYKADVPETMDNVVLTLFAHIEQNTGEDWQDIELALSNALPITSRVLPELYSWYLRPPVAPAPVAMAAAADDMTVGSAVVDAGASGDLEDQADLDALVMEEPHVGAAYARAERKELPVAFEYNVSLPTSIQSGDRESLVPLSSESLGGQFFHYAVPSSDSQAYLVCKTAGDSTLMAGRLNIHFGGRFIGGTQLTEKKPGEDLLLNLGPQRGIKVSRDKIVDSITETFFGMVDRNSVARELQFRISVENLKDSTERIQVIDSVAVSATDRFQVKGLEMQPEPAEKDWKKREGVMMWELDIEPGTTKEISIKFFVKHPKDQPPTGL